MIFLVACSCVISSLVLWFRLAIWYLKESRKFSFSKLSKFRFSNCQKFLFQTVKIFLSKLSKFRFSNCQKFLFQTVKIFLFQTVKISLFKLSKIPFSNCQNFAFQTVKISLFKLSKFSFPNCQNFPFQTVKISLFKLSKISLSKLSQIHQITLSDPKITQKEFVFLKKLAFSIEHIFYSMTHFYWFLSNINYCEFIRQFFYDFRGDSFFLCLWFLSVILIGFLGVFSLELFWGVFCKYWSSLGSFWHPIYPKSLNGYKSWAFRH